MIILNKWMSRATLHEQILHNISIHNKLTAEEIQIFQILKISNSWKKSKKKYLLVFTEL